MQSKKLLFAALGVTSLIIGIICATNSTEDEPKPKFCTPAENNEAQKLRVKEAEKKEKERIIEMVANHQREMRQKEEEELLNKVRKILQECKQENSNSNVYYNPNNHVRPQEIPTQNEAQATQRSIDQILAMQRQRINELNIAQERERMNDKIFADQNKAYKDHWNRVIKNYYGENASTIE